MPGKQAKVVTPPMLKRMLRHVSHSSLPARERAMILLSVKSGLRACEIAGLDWSMVLDAQGRVSGTIHVLDRIAKKRGGRRIPMHPDLRRALERLARTTEPVGPVIRSYRGSHLTKCPVPSGPSDAIRSRRPTSHQPGGNRQRPAHPGIDAVIDAASDDGQPEAHLRPTTSLHAHTDG
jgi:integrase